MINNNSDRVIFYQIIMLFFLFARVTKHTMAADFSNVSVDLPKFYDFTEAYPHCDFGPLQQPCGCCYAYSALKVMSHRFCKITGKKLMFSPQNVVACDLFDLGCVGGNEKSVFYYMEQHGVTDIDCHPWKDVLQYSPQVCNKCFGNRKMQHYFAEKWSTKHYIGIDNIKKGIFLEGPIAASVGTDWKFDKYQGGYYTSSIDLVNGAANHSVEIIGWGEEKDGKPYWIAYNHHGAHWGKNGKMTIRMGHNDGFIESYLTAALPLLN